MKSWEIIAPAGIVAMGVAAFLAVWLSPKGAHRGDPAELEPGPDIRDLRMPVKPVEGKPPWATGLTDGQDDPLTREILYGISEGLRTQYGPGSLGTWFPHEEHHESPPGSLTPQAEAQLRNALRLPYDLPGEDGAGDESEACGPPAPPAPLWEYRAQNPDLAGEVVQFPRLISATDLALARCDAFMVAMRADHARWLAGARERWAAAC